MINPIFKSKQQWNCKLNTFLGLPKRTTDAEAMSELNKANPPVSTFNDDIAIAACLYAKELKTCGNTTVVVKGQILDFLKEIYQITSFSLTCCGTDLFASEVVFHSDDGTPIGYIVAIYNSQNGNVEMAHVSSNGLYAPLNVGQSTLWDGDLVPLYLCMFPCIGKISSRTVTTVPPTTSGGSLKTPLRTIELDNIGHFTETDLHLICDYVYQAINQGVLPLKIPADGNVDMVNKTAVEAGTYNGSLLVGDEPTLLTGVQKKSTSVKTQAVMLEAKKEFADFASSHAWTKEEEALIPSFPDDYPIAPEAMKIASRYVNSRENVRPMNNFMWRGVTSYGKSTGVEQIACMLHIPLLKITCHSNMETQNFLSDFVPDTSSVATIPTFEEIELDPETAYRKITGKEHANATPDDCVKALANANTSGAPRFKHVVSNFVKALINGYIIEVQEPSRIKDAGVLVGLNEYDRAGAVIPLVDGSFGTRHKDALAIYTNNVGYVSCRQIDPSVIRRMSIIIDSYELPKRQLFERVVYNTGFDDYGQLEKAYEVFQKVIDFCHSRDITEGSLSATEFESFIQCYQADGCQNFKQNFIECVVSKATSDKDEQDEIISSVLDIL